MTHVLYDNESLALGKAIYERFWECKHDGTQAQMGRHQ